MPYIKKEDRPKLDKLIEALSMNIENEGELNYTITRLIHLLVKKWGESYSTYNKLIGVLSCVDKEFYRKKTVPYEKQKEFENGDIE